MIEFEFESPLRGVSLQQFLQQRGQAMRAALNQEVRGVLDRHVDEGAYISAAIDRFNTEIPQLDFDPAHIQKADNIEEHSGEQLYRGHSLNRSYRYWVVTFGIPYTGEINYLRYIPRSGSSLSFPQLFRDDRYLYLKTQVLDTQERDIQPIKAERDKGFAFLQERLSAIVPDLKDFNQAIERDVPALFETLKQKYQKDKDALALL